MTSLKVFQSKIDWWLILLVLAIPGWPIVKEWSNNGAAHPPQSFWVFCAVLAVMVVALTPIRYVIDGKTVRVKCGMIGWEYTAFSVDDVQSIRPTRNPLASPALSLNRLKVDLGFRSILLSPGNKSEFMSTVGMLNPNLHLRDNSLVRT